MGFIEIRNPATGEHVGSVRAASPADIESAVTAARRAQKNWSGLHWSQRAAVVRKFHDLVLDRCDSVLDIIQSETGKARRDAFGEIVTVAGTARYYLAHGESHLSGKR